MRTVRIYGMSNNVKNAPPAPPDVEVWCINNPRGYRFQRLAAFREWTRWFNIHTANHQKTRYPKGWEFFKKQDTSKIIYLQEVEPDVVASRKFPREELQEFFKTSNKPQRYFTCTGAWLIALAIYEGFEQIDIWGHQMKIGGEHHFQRPGFLYWVQEARRRGIVVNIPPGCIGHPQGDGTDTAPGNPETYTGFLYGYEPHNSYTRETF